MRIAVAVLALAALLSASLAGATATARDPKTLVLRQADLPVDFRQTSVRRISNAQATKETAVKKNLVQLGRLEGYESTYEKRAARGIRVVLSRASTYRTAAGAHESLELDLAGAQKSRAPRFRRVPLETEIGDEAYFHRAMVKQGRTTVEIYTLAWRSDKVYAAVIGSGVAGTGKPWFVVKLAKRQQERIG